MTSLLLPSAVALLAHKRLADAAELLDRKVNGGGRAFTVLFTGRSATVVNPTERRVLALAQEARRMFEGGPKAQPVPPGLAVGPGIGSFALLGSAGFELPGYADALAPGGAWVADAVRRGTPDPNLSLLVVGSTAFAVRAGELALDRPGVTAQDAARIRAFAMGLLSAVASGVVTGPVLRGLQARRTARDWSRHDPAVDIGAAEQRILNGVLGGAGAAARWQGWWPASADIPASLLDGYVAALEEAYGLTAARELGFADFKEGFSAGDALSATRLRNAYALLRQDAASSKWGAGTWYLVLLPVLLMPPVALLAARALPNGRGLVAQDTPATERSVFEVLTVGMGFGALPPIGYSIALWATIDEHVDVFVNALVLFLARAGLVGTIAGTSTQAVDAGVRWGVLFPLLIGTDLYALVRGIVAKVEDRPGDAFVFFLQLIAAGTGALVLTWAALIEALGKTDEAYWIMFSILAAGLLLGGIPVAMALANTGGYRSFFLREQRFPLLDSVRAAAGETNPAALAHLFDDSTLWHDPAVANPSLDQLRYPAGRRALVRVWWTGAGALQVKQGADALTFILADGSTKTVALGATGTTAAALATRLAAEVPGLQTEAVGPNDPAYRLPIAQTFADPGDTLATLAEHDQHRGDAVTVGTSREQAHLVRHTPRGKLATTYGLFGATASAIEGRTLAPGGGLGDLEESALGLAADLTVLLGLGAAPSLARPAIPDPAAGGSLTPVFQVFRQWNLDERRVNEWRMLVHGGAESEKPGAAGERDPAMRPNPVPGAPAYASPAAAGEPVATAMGWIPLWRAWLRMASDVTADSSAPRPMPYTPTIVLNGQAVQPTNAQLTDAVRFLLDLAA